MKYNIFVLVEVKHTELFTSYGDCLVNTKVWVPSVGFTVAGLDHTKFGFFEFQRFLFIVVMVISILLKTTFSPISIHSQLLVKILCQSDKEKKLSRRLKNIGMASEKLYRNILKNLFTALHLFSFVISNRRTSFWTRINRKNAMKLTAFKKAYYFIQFYSHFNLLPFI